MYLYHNIISRCGNKMFLAFLSLAVIGIALFVAVVFFHSWKDKPERNDQDYTEPVVHDHVPDPLPNAQKPEIREDAATMTPESEGTPETVSKPGVGKGVYIPILQIDEEIPGLKGRELIHFDGGGSLYSLESTAELKNLEFSKDDLELVVEGRLLLTSRYIIVYRAAVVKKFTIAAVEDFRFKDSFLVMKRKRVKTKKDVLKVSGKLEDFKYILHALT
jgi:hypothetical protein